MTNLALPDHADNEHIGEHIGDSTGFLLLQVSSAWQRTITAALRPYGLTQAQFTLLSGMLQLSEHETYVTQVKLARHTCSDVMMTSQVLRTLESRGLVERNPHPTDTRAKILVLTEIGERTVLRAMPAVNRIDMDFFSDLGEQRTVFYRMLHKLSAHDPCAIVPDQSTRVPQIQFIEPTSHAGLRQ
ncbi:MarR family winged helix-turn-helix transcriptional regulator [Andreprevotia chitinilytica]|uniref:MarR family winged helix-turn-helix transcriptional regulator n=1 Tax=Andreprevotia chitinilytica TaxID=396808 RepID=UPI000A003332|nr:MarR family transcriptional regulator [Andreprevotia chitinilytica]